MTIRFKTRNLSSYSRLMQWKNSGEITPWRIVPGNGRVRGVIKRLTRENGCCTVVMSVEETEDGFDPIKLDGKNGFERVNQEGLREYYRFTVSAHEKVLAEAYRKKMGRTMWIEVPGSQPIYGRVVQVRDPRPPDESAWDRHYSIDIEVIKVIDGPTNIKFRVTHAKAVQLIRAMRDDRLVTVQWMGEDFRGHVTRCEPEVGGRREMIPIYEVVVTRATPPDNCRCAPVYEGFMDQAQSEARMHRAASALAFRNYDITRIEEELYGNCMSQTPLTKEPDVKIYDAVVVKINEQGEPTEISKVVAPFLAKDDAAAKTQVTVDFAIESKLAGKDLAGYQVRVRTFQSVG